MSLPLFRCVFTLLRTGSNLSSHRAREISCRRTLSTFAIIISVFSITSFAKDVPDLKTGKYVGHYNYNVSANYQDVHKRVVKGAKKCYRFSKEKVRANLDEDANLGRVAVISGGFCFGRKALISIDIAPDRDNSTVDVYYGFKNWHRSASAVEGWANGTSKKCKGPKK